MVSDTLIMDTDGVTEDTGATLAVIGVPDGAGVTQPGATLDTGDLVTDTTTMLITTEEEDLLLTIAEETTLTTEDTLTEVLQQTEVIPPETTIQTEATTQTETIQLTDRMDILILEEALIQMEEHTILQAQLLPTEEAQVKDKTIVLTILTEDQATPQQEATTTVTHQEVTLLAHHVQ